jgi:hypothetical protein
MNKRDAVNGSWEKRGRRRSKITLYFEVRGSHLCGKSWKSENEGEKRKEGSLGASPVYGA